MIKHALLSLLQQFLLSDLFFHLEVLRSELIVDLWNLTNKIVISRAQGRLVKLSVVEVFKDSDWITDYYSFELLFSLNHGEGALVLLIYKGVRL